MKHTKYSYRTHGNESGYYASGITKRRHKYGKHTRLGEHISWKEMGSVALCLNKCFATRQEAKEAGEAWVKEKNDALAKHTERASVTK
jgi:hypothetical protein